MAKFRSNHAQQDRGSGGMIVKVGIFGAIVGGLYMLFDFFSGGEAPSAGPTQDPSVYAAEEYSLPSVPRGSQLVQHEHFSLSYNDDFEQADWVSFVLTRENLSKDWNQRVDNFRPDPSVEAGTATPADYRGSGYDRGHLVAAADMAWDVTAMDETFYMSNISPQSRNFNKGIWRELEEVTRNWAKRFGRIYVVTGPVLSIEPKGYIGRDNEVAVPAAYYRILLDIDEPEQKAIAFVIPNEISYDPLYKFVRSVDEAEELTGIDFYPDLMPEDLEEELEAEYNIDLWEFSKQKYDLRVEKWNESQ